MFLTYRVRRPTYRDGLAYESGWLILRIGRLLYPYISGRAGRRESGVKESQ